ncbi:hypothetical protein FRC12_004762 [Ceratobasidium sp. 428]|nr:hypothetical protein FRC12_004762 [Ceratobasidium sp. 428]
MTPSSTPAYRIFQSSGLQTIPAEILVIIFEILSNSRTEPYASFICSHVCAHWRRIIINSPSLWSYIDTSRGEGLTRLWLSRSKQVPIDVRLWEDPLDCDIMRGTNHLPQPYAPSFGVGSIVQCIKDEVHRWRSLDIAFCDMYRITQILAFLGGDFHSTPHLESLTIGPMGSTTLISLQFPSYHPGPSPDITAARSLLEKLNVSCDILRIDMCPIAFSPTLFSSRLTFLEVSTESRCSDYGDFEQWRKILSHTPNLVHLRLRGFQCLAASIDIDHSTNISLLELPFLEKLEIAGGFTRLIPYLGKSLFPRLEILALDSFSEPRVVGDLLASIISWVPPPVRCLSISAGDNQWGTILRTFHLLEQVSLLKMHWEDVIVIMASLAELPSLICIRLEHIWDMNMANPSFKTLRSCLPPIEFVDCFEGGRSVCRCLSEDVCESEDQSNYSDNSSFSSISQLFGYPSSEETGSNESERSYGEEENIGIATST